MAAGHPAAPAPSGGAGPSAVQGSPAPPAAAPQGEAGLVTCTQQHFEKYGLGLAFAVALPVAVVLDLPELSLGNILGVLQHGDVVIPCHLQTPWIRLKAGSFVRHTKMRGGRVKLPVDGWMLVESAAYGQVLALHSVDEVQRRFASGAFLRLPLVKDAARPPEPEQAPQAREEAVARQQPESEQAPPRARQDPREEDATGRPEGEERGPWVARRQAPPAKEAAGRPEAEERGPWAARRQAPPAKGSAQQFEPDQESAVREKPRERKGSAQQLGEPDLESAVRERPRAARKGTARQPDTEQALGPREGQRKSKARGEAQALAARLSPADAAAMLVELLEGYSAEDFGRAAEQLQSGWAKGLARSSMVDEIDGLCARAAGPVIARYGFAGDAQGMKDANAAVLAVGQLHPEVLEKHKALQRHIFASFPHCFGMEKHAAPAGAGAAAAARAAPSRGVAPAEPAPAAAPAAAAATRPPEASGAHAAGSYKEAGATARGAPRLQHWQLVEESFAEHLARCSSDHYRVLPKFVFVRDRCSTGAAQLNVCHQGVLICSRCTSHLLVPSPEGLWVQCAAGALCWADAQASHATALLAAETVGYILLRHPQLGPLVELVRRGSAPPEEVSGERADERTLEEEVDEPDISMYDIAVPDMEPMPDLALVDHWVVEVDGVRLLEHESPTARTLLTLSRGDVLLLGQQPPQLHLNGLRYWLRLGLRARVFSRGRKVYPPAGAAAAGAQLAVAEEGGAALVRQAASTATGGTVLRTLTGFGEPWVVEHDQVAVRQGPCQKEQLVGILTKGDILGVKRCKGEWVELVRDANVRMRPGPAGTEPVYSFNDLRTSKLEPVRVGEKVKYRDFSAPLSKQVDRASSLWMMVTHPTLGQLLRRCRKRRGGLEGGCLLSQERRELYRQVVSLCHKRIFEDNLESLWEGEREKMPTREALEAKLFDSNVTVIHATVEGHFAGGAIIKEVPVRAYGGESGINVGVATAQQSHSCPGRTLVGYVDCCAAEPGLHAGSAIWDAISGMSFLCVACHSILLQGTVAFWSGRGLRRFDPSSRQDGEEFSSAILMRTHGTVKCELPDLQKALPASKLPLFIWIPKTLGMDVESDPHQDYIFTPDSHEGAAESWDY